MQNKTPEELFNLLPSWLKNQDKNIYNSNNYVVVDFETTILDKGSPYEKENRIVCSSFRLGEGHSNFKGTTEYCSGNEYEQARLVDLIEQADFWVAHNSKFEYGWLERCGLPLEKTLAWCTMIGEYILLSNRSNPNMLGLNKCLERRGFPTKSDIGSKLLKAGVCPSTWPERWIKPYCMRDVELTEKLFLNQRKAMQQRNKLGVMLTRCMFTAPLVDIEKNGMHLDADRVPVLWHSYMERLGELTHQLSIVTGGANPASPKQMREVLYDQLKFPKPSDRRFMGKNDEPTTSFDYIGLLKPKNKKQRVFIQLKQEWSKVNAALIKSLTKFKACIDETDDAILTATMNQCITVTQRLSSSGKNYKCQFQNFARIFKPLFKARNKGWKIGEIDQAQLEYRVAVWYGQDEAGMHDIAAKIDAHSYTATEMWGNAYTDLEMGSEKRNQMRTAAKADTFKPLFGGKSGNKDQVRYYTAFMKKHAGIERAQDEWKMAAINEGKVEIPSGLTFYFPNTRILEDGYITNSTNICNYPVQSFATADIVPIGVTYQWHLMRVASLQSFLINTIHDSSIGEVHPDEEERYAEIGRYAFVDVVYQYLTKVYDVEFNVPLEAETKFSTNWADSEYWRSNYLTSEE